MANITRYDPFHEALTLRDAMNQLFAQSFVNPTWSQGSSESMFAPMNVSENDQGYQVEVSLPGVKPEDIDLTVHQNTLSVRGHYHQEKHQGQGQSNQQNQQSQQNQQQNQPNWLMREIHSGSFERTLTFPKPIDADKVTTNYEYGILTINVPLSEVSRPKKISVSGQHSGQSQQVNVSNQGR